MVDELHTIRVDNFDGLVQRIRDDDTFMAVTDISNLEDEQASAGWCFYAPSSDKDDKWQRWCLEQIFYLKVY